MGLGLICHAMYSPTLYAKLFILLCLPIAIKKQSCLEIHKL